MSAPSAAPALSQRKLTVADLKAPRPKPPLAAAAKGVPAKPKGPKRDKSWIHPIVKAAIGRLSERWPAAFNDERKPLAIGIHEAIFAEPDFNLTCVESALQVWTRHDLYLQNLARGGQRIALDGSDAGEISEQHRKDAAAFAKGRAP